LRCLTFGISYTTHFILLGLSFFSVHAADFSCHLACLCSYTTTIISPSLYGSPFIPLIEPPVASGRAYFNMLIMLSLFPGPYPRLYRTGPEALFLMNLSWVSRFLLAGPSPDLISVAVQLTPTRRLEIFLPFLAAKTSPYPFFFFFLFFSCGVNFLPPFLGVPVDHLATHPVCIPCSLPFSLRESAKRSRKRCSQKSSRSLSSLRLFYLIPRKIVFF